MNPITKNRVLLFSGPNFLALTILEYLLSKGFFVYIFTSSKSEWQRSTVNIAFKNRFEISSNFREINFNNISYEICIEGYDRFQNKFIVNPEIKTIILTPFENYNDISKILPTGNNIANIFLGDLVGPRMDISFPLLINSTLKSIVDKRLFEVAVGEFFYPLNVLDVTKTIFNYMFSFGPYGKRLLILGPQTSASNFLEINSHFFKNIQLKINPKKADRKLPAETIKKEIDSDVSVSLAQTYKWIFKDADKTAELKDVKKQNILFRNIVITSLFIFLIPFASLFVSLLIYYTSYRNLNIQNINIAKPSLIATKESSRFLSSIPLIGKVYKETQFISDILLKTGDLLVDSQPLVDNLSDLPNKVLGNQVYDLSKISVDNKNTLQLIYKDFLVINETVDGSYYKNLYLQNFIKNKINFTKVSNLLRNSIELIGNMGEILGTTKPQTYLVLFQNNMELRPTGGFIGSYGTVVFSEGRLNEMNVSDVYSADGQLKGHVEPPQPIRDYLNEANWYLRDSNWDPDFLISSKRAEWFLDKEIGQSYDGVVAIDLSPIKDILDITGPIFLSDYNMDITSENLYEKTQQEVEQNFFAGSRKKASFLTALSRNLISRFGSMSIREKIRLIIVIYNNLEKRHIQVALHNQKIQKSISDLNWDGSVRSPNCANECYADIVGVVEANLGVNKVNQFITRKVDLEVGLDENFIYRKLTLSIKNSANISLGPNGRYKVFARVVGVGDAEFLDNGQWVEILPSSSRDIVFNWKSPKPKDFDIRKYKLYFRKQAGIDRFSFYLTVDGKNLYNDSLDQDLFLDYK